MVCMLLTRASLALKDDRDQPQERARLGVVSEASGMEERAALDPETDHTWTAGGA